MDKKQPKPPTFFQCIKPILLYFLINIAVTVVFVSVKIGSDAQRYMLLEYTEMTQAIMEQMSGTVVYITAISALVAIVFGYKRFRLNEKLDFDAKYRFSLSLKNTLDLTALAIGAYVLTAVFFIILYGISVSDEQTQLIEMVYSESFIINILVYSLLSPIAEEIIYRALVYNRFRKIRNDTFAIILSALMYASFNSVSFANVIYTFALGYLLAYAYSKYQSIIAPIIIHCVFMLCDTLYSLPFIENLLSQKIGMYIFYFVGFVCFVYAVGALKKKEPPELINQTENMLSDEQQ